jgi:hypothetical protein
MTPEEVKPPEPEPSAKSEEIQPKDLPQEDPDSARGEAFKRMFPDVPRKRSEQKAMRDDSLPLSAASCHPLRQTPPGINASL